MARSQPFGCDLRAKTTEGRRATVQTTASSIVSGNNMLVQRVFTPDCTKAGTRLDSRRNKLVAVPVHAATGARRGDRTGGPNADYASVGGGGRSRATDVIKRIGNRIGANCEYAPVNRKSTIAGIMSADWRGVRSAAKNSAK